MDRPTYFELFAGIGGFGLAVRRVWPTARCVGYVERDAYAAAALLARMEDSSLGVAPVWVGDIRDLDERSLPPRVDMLLAGFPCQDISNAGTRAGIGGEHSGLWAEVVRIAALLEPSLILLENVSAITRRGLDQVLGDLAALGFDAVWTCAEAREAGYPHRRRRWFCVAVPDGNRRAGRATNVTDGTAPIGARGGARVDASMGEVPLRELVVSQASKARPQLRLPPHRGMGHESIPPGPHDFDGWERVVSKSPHLAPAIKSGVCGLVDGVPVVVDESRSDQLRALGNAIHWPTAEIALRWCLAQIGGE